MSPTARSLAELRKRGFRADVVEQWIPRAKIRKDLFGCIDIVAIGKDGRLLGIQATTGDNHAARCTKLINHDNYAAICNSPIELWVWSWRKSAKDNRWKLREEYLGGGTEQRIPIVGKVS